MQHVLVHFLNKLQGANEFLDQPLVVSSVKNELRNEQHFFQTYEVVKVEWLNNPHYLLLDSFCWDKGFASYIFYRLTVLKSVTIPQIKLCSLLLRKFSGQNINLWGVFNVKTILKKFSNHFTGQYILPLWIKTGIFYPIYYNLLQIHNELVSQLKKFSHLNTTAITAIRPDYRFLDEMRSFHTKITEKLKLKNQNILLVLVSNLKPRPLLLI